MIPSASPTAAGWSCFEAFVRGEETSLARLFAAPDAPAFTAACLALAAERGLKLAAEDVAAAISAARRERLQRHLSLPAPPGMIAPAPAENQAPPADWLPIHLHGTRTSGAPPPASGPPQLEWARFGELRLTDPFFEQTTGAALRSPAALLFRRRCTMDTLEAAFGAAIPELLPAGFVFHLSRCGSTLLAQILAASPRHRVLSEAPPIDQLLAHDAALALPRPRRVARLRALVNAYARRRFPGERHLFIKWDAWHTLHLDLIQEAFPRTPWIYLHRDPVEILVSQRRQRGYQFLPGMMNPALFGITPSELPIFDFDAYAARVLGASAAAAVRALARPGHRGLAVEYSNLRHKLPSLLRDHFGLHDCDEAEQAAMHAAAARDAKNPVQPFAADGEQKLREADDSLRALADRWLGESRRALVRL